MAKAPHPIPYQGSKRNIANRILEYLPKDTDVLIESFAGSAAITLAVAEKNLAKNFILNDINAPLIGIWQNILSSPEELADEYKNIWTQQLGNEKDYYLKIRDEFNKTQQPEKLLYLLARCVKNAVRYNEKGEFNQGSDNRRKGKQPEKMSKQIMDAHNLLKNRTVLFSKDYREVNLLAKKDDVIYMDPPYQGTVKGSKRYIKGLELETFIQHIEELNNLGLSFIISFDGRTGDKTYGDSLPNHLQLKKLEIDAGRSSQATLNGENKNTYESIYLSKALLDRI